MTFRNETGTVAPCGPCTAVRCKSPKPHIALLWSTFMIPFRSYVYPRRQGVMAADTHGEKKILVAHMLRERVRKIWSIVSGFRRNGVAGMNRRLSGQLSITPRIPVLPWQSGRMWGISPQRWSFNFNCLICGAFDLFRCRLCSLTHLVTTDCHVASHKFLALLSGTVSCYEITHAAVAHGRTTLFFPCRVTVKFLK